MPWKKNGDAVVLDDKSGDPIWIHEDKKEVPWNVPAQLAAQTDLVNTKKALKADLEKAESTLKTLETKLGDGLKDPDRLAIALATLSEVEAGKLVNEGKKDEAVQKAREDERKEALARYAALEKQFNDLKGKHMSAEEKLDTEKRKELFFNSKFLKDHTRMPEDLAFREFGDNYKITVDEAGNRVAIPYLDGEKMYSNAPDRPGKYADPDEALERWFTSYKHKNTFLPDNGSGPPGGDQGSKTAQGDIILRGADAKSHSKYLAAQAAVAKQGYGKVILRPKE